MSDSSDKENKLQKHLSVLACPLEGKSEQEVLNCLLEHGATDIKMLGKGFISATVSQEGAKATELVARVEPKRKKRMHRRR